MEIKVKSKYLHISPAKVRPVLHGYRGLSAEKALSLASFTNKKAAHRLADLIKSGIAVAKENYLEPGAVTIKAIFCGDGPRLKRIQPWSKGQARRITKRMCHLALVLESQEQESQSKNKNTDKKEIDNKESKTQTQNNN